MKRTPSTCHELNCMNLVHRQRGRFEHDTNARFMLRFKQSGKFPRKYSPFLQTSF